MMTKKTVFLLLVFLAALWLSRYLVLPNRRVVK